MSYRCPRKNSDSEWGCSTFIRSKKTGDVQVCTDFLELNKHIKRKAYLIPKISEVLQSLAGFKTATALDLSMGYYHIPADEESQKLCSFVMPLGKYRYATPYGNQSRSRCLSGSNDRTLFRLGLRSSLSQQYPHRR
jgi:hypothetical protein